MLVSGNSFQCTNDDSNRVNPSFGALSVQQNTGTYEFQQTNGGPDFQDLNFVIKNYNSDNNYIVSLIDISNNSITELEYSNLCI